jgi:hypothetical protein
LQSAFQIAYCIWLWVNDHLYTLDIFNLFCSMVNG